VYETCPPHWEFLGKRVVPDWLYHQRCSGVLRSTHKYVVVGIKRVIDANGVIKLLLVFRRQPAKACGIKTIANRVIVRLRHGAQHLLHGWIKTDVRRIGCRIHGLRNDVHTRQRIACVVDRSVQIASCTFRQPLSI
jgi:hypothetical protein